MIRTIRLVLLNPAWREHEFAGGLIFSSGGVALDSPEAVTSCTDGAVVHVGRGATLIDLYRSLTTSDQLYCVLRDGVLTISDHFAAVLHAIPVAERRVPESAVIDHFLFRTTPGVGTYVAGVRRIGNAEHVRWAAPDGAATARVVARLEPAGSFDVDEAAARLDRILGAALREHRAELHNLLSGGVDSTLLHSFVPGQPTVSATLDSPEFGMEARYAEAAARLFEREHAFVKLREVDYGELLAGVIRRLSLPPHHLQTVLIDAALSTGATEYMTAQFADALFGLDRSLRVWRITRYRLERSAALVRLLAALPWSRARRFDEALDQDLSQLSEAVDSPWGFGSLFAVYSDLSAAVALFGRSAVEARLEQRLDYVRERVAPYRNTDAHEYRHLELGHWVDFFCDDTVSVWRQCAHSRGVSLLAPFSGHAVAALALSVPARDRFCRDGSVKPVLKALLRQRVPAYPVEQQKGGSGLPLSRYLAEGPLRGHASDALQGDWPVSLRSLRAPVSDWIVWNQLTFRMWDEQVRQQRDLPGVPPGTLLREITCGEPLRSRGATPLAG
jgi:hypothetical protein